MRENSSGPPPAQPAPTPTASAPQHLCQQVLPGSPETLKDGEQKVWPNSALGLALTLSSGSEFTLGGTGGDKKEGHKIQLGRKRFC